jgi:hypothetical protein
MTCLGLNERIYTATIARGVAFLKDIVKRRVLFRLFGKLFYRLKNAFPYDPHILYIEFA